jgi:hypothetical protein
MRCLRISIFLVAMSGVCCSAWLLSAQQQPQHFSIAASSSRHRSRLYNVPPPSETDTVAFTQFANKQSPPSSFFELQQDCIRATRLAIRDGHRLLEVEFPPLAANVLEMDDVSAYDIQEANLNLAIGYAKGLLQGSSSATTTTQQAINKIVILLPDEAELDIAVERTVGTKTPYPGIEISSLRKSDPYDYRLFKPEQVLLSLFGGSSGGVIQATNDTDLYICLTASAQELPDIEELSTLEPNKTIVFYNLKLDVLRGDLGAPAFPSKDFQDRFLSRVKPVYYLRTRQYSRSTVAPPFMVNYQGCLFRCYPGQFQTLLDTGNGKYRRLCGNDYRPALGEFKEQLTDALKEQGVLKDEGKTFEFLRTGYKTATWWEEERENASNDWRT